jgi:hypothetical protein
MGIPGSGQTVMVEGMNFYRLKDGRVSDMWTQSTASDDAATRRHPRLTLGPAPQGAGVDGQALLRRFVFQEPRRLRRPARRGTVDHRIRGGT